MDEDFEGELAEVTDKSKGILEHIACLAEGSKAEDVPGFTIYMSTEKIHTLQECLHFEIVSDDEETEIAVSIASGIDTNGVVDYSFEGNSLMHEPLTAEIISGVTLDRKRVAEALGKRVDDIPKKKWDLFEKIFEGHKDEILDIYRKQSYDNYMTGGGTNATDKHYQKLKKKLHNRNIYWEIQYETVEVDRNIV